MDVYIHQIIFQHLALLENQLEDKEILLHLIYPCNLTPSEKPN